MLVTRTKIDLGLNSWQFLALCCVLMSSYGGVPASFTGLHHFTASLNGRGEFERLKFIFFPGSGSLLLSTSFWKRSFLFHLTQLHKLNLCSWYRAKGIWWSHDWLTVYQSWLCHYWYASHLWWHHVAHHSCRRCGRIGHYRGCLVWETVVNWEEKRSAAYCKTLLSKDQLQHSAYYEHSKE